MYRSGNSSEVIVTANYLVKNEIPIYNKEIRWSRGSYKVNSYRRIYSFYRYENKIFIVKYFFKRTSSFRIPSNPSSITLSSIKVFLKDMKIHYHLSFYNTEAYNLYLEELLTKIPEFKVELALELL